MLFRNFLSVTLGVALMGATLAHIINSTRDEGRFSIHHRALENYSSPQQNVQNGPCVGDKTCLNLSTATAFG